MASEQFSQAVRGSGGTPISTTAAGSIQTDNYDAGDAIDEDGSTYPVTINPSEVIQDLILTAAGDIEMEVTTVQGETFTVPLESTVGRWQIWEIDKIVFRDPQGTTARLAGGWAGE